VKTHNDKIKRNKNHINNGSTLSTQNSDTSTFQFKDNRPETTTQVKLREMANDFSTKQSVTQKKEDNSDKIAQLKQNEVIQLNEGLAGDETIADAAKSIAPHKDLQQPLVTWVTHNYLEILHIAYASLASHKIPAPEYAWESMHGPAATFNFRTWKIEFNSNLQDQNWSKIDLATLLYHESRHAEQFFRMIKNKLRSGMSPEEVAQFFNMDKSLIEKVILPAKAQLPPPPKPKEAGAEALKPEMDEKAKIWEDSVMGSGSEKRALVLYRWQRLEYLKSRITELENFRNSVHSAIEELFINAASTKPPAETEKYCTSYLKATGTYLKKMAEWISKSLDDILKEKHPEFGKEPILEEVYKKLPMNDFMKKYIGYLAYFKLSGEVHSMRIEFAKGEEAQLLTAKSTDERLSADIEAYLHLPEEVDAYETQGKLTAAISEL